MAHFDYVAKEHEHRVVDVTDGAVADLVRRLLARPSSAEAVTQFGILSQ
jgi:hypothetical protein